VGRHRPHGLITGQGIRSTHLAAILAELLTYPDAGAGEAFVREQAGDGTAGGEGPGNLGGD
jgi:hypothetical protein